MKTLFQTIIFFTCFQYHADHWTQKTDVGGSPRNGAAGFSINSTGKGYVGTGCSCDGNPTGLKDFWEFDPSGNSWTQKADYPGKGRVGLFSFSIGSKGYMGGGSLVNGITPSSMFADFWEYDPATDTWTQKANIPAPKCNSFTFSIGSKGYVGGGWDSIVTPSDDFWEYDPATDSWMRKANFPGEKGFNDKGIGTSSEGYVYTMLGYYLFKYNPATDQWIQKAKTGVGPMLRGAVAFSICDNIYIGTGQINISGSHHTNELWMYDPVSDLWSKKTSFPGAPRNGGTGFSLSGKGYIGTGGFGLTDWYEYSPDPCPPNGVRELSRTGEWVYVHPNPFSEALNIDPGISQLKEIILYDNSSKVVLQRSLTINSTIDTQFLPAGFYIYELRDKNGPVKRGKIVKQ